MTGEVVHISSGETILNERGVNEDAIACAEWLMKAALAGEITGIAAAYVFADGGTGYQCGGNAACAATVGQLFKMATEMASE